MDTMIILKYVNGVFCILNILQAMLCLYVNNPKNAFIASGVALLNLYAYSTLASRDSDDNKDV